MILNLIRQFGGMMSPMWRAYRFLVIAFLPVVFSPAFLTAEDTHQVERVAATPAAPVQHPKRVGGTVSAPTLVYTVDMPGLARMDVELILNFWVDAQGIPSHIRIVQGGDLAQNEKIIEAVRQYRFKPAMENGKPVLVEMNMEVDVD